MVGSDGSLRSTMPHDSRSSIREAHMSSLLITLGALLAAVAVGLGGFVRMA